MEEDFTILLKRLENINPVVGNEEKLRELIFEILPLCSFEEKQQVLLLSRQKLRKLQNRKDRYRKSCGMKSCDISTLFESVTRSSDIILSDVGKSLDFSFQKCQCDICPELIIDAFLNLISNSAKFSRSSRILLSMKAENGSEVITVENEGSCSCAEFSKEGIKTAAAIAKLHSGRLFYSSFQNRVKASMSFPVKRESKIRYEAPMFFDYLTDDFSKVQIGLADVF